MHPGDLSLPRRASGASLLEMMIALFVLGVGLLGVISMQSEAIKYNQQAYTNTEAQQLATDLAERLRIQPEQFIAANGTFGNIPDYVDWQTLVARSLPKGAGSLTARAEPRAFDVVLQFEQQVLNTEKTTVAVATKPKAETLSYRLVVQL